MTNRTDALVTFSILKKILIGATSLVLVSATIGIIGYVISFGFHSPIYKDGGLWDRLKSDDTHLSPSMRLALLDSPTAVPGQFSWREIAPGFQIGELTALVNRNVVDQIRLARIDPSRFRFAVCHKSGGLRNVDQWMHTLGAVLVVNGSYFAPGGKPATPLLSNGKLLGPKEYAAKGGAFPATDGQARIGDLANQRWQTVFQGMTSGLVSYPILVAADGSNHVQKKSRWLANRSFIAKDKSGWIVIGTTTDAFFSLDRLAEFLRQSPLESAIALDLDGGPVACQSIKLNGFERKTYGKWEMRTEGDDALLLLTAPYIPPPLRIVVAVFPK
jgi:hypothetical protein